MENVLTVCWISAICLRVNRLPPNVVDLRFSTRGWESNSDDTTIVIVLSGSEINRLRVSAKDDDVLI